jgi:uncharacterized RDD family membrane protein YckC
MTQDPLLDFDDSVGGRPAGFWIRVLAILIDFAIFTPIALAGLWAMQRGSIPVIIAIYIPLLLYKPVMESKYGATLGKMVCRIGVRDRNGDFISVKTAYIRFLPFLLYNIANLILSIQLFQNPEYLDASTVLEKGLIVRSYPMRSIKQLFTLFILVDYLVIAFRKRKLAIHDSMAKTVCIYRKKIKTENSQ